MNNLRTAFYCLFLLGGAIITVAQTQSGLELIGKVHSRSSKEIASSSWSIGGETLDRDFAVYANYRKYLGPLGAKAIRLQAGWAKCEKSSEVYDWKWLDDSVDDALAQGVQPWLELSYGNPIYPGGGEIGLGGGFPSSPDALTAWDRWVRLTVERYKNRVHEWEIWNEPDGNRKGTAEAAAYVDLYIRTATIIRTIQPNGRIYALALAGRFDYADKFLTGMSERKKLDLIDALTIHGYPLNPDNILDVERIRQRIVQTGRSIEIREGETGAPSKFQAHFALSNTPWSETTQSKWDLRRMLIFRSIDVPFNLFTIMDMRYQREGQIQMNYKGLLAIQEDSPGMIVAYAKPAYYAVQNVFSIFDESLERVTDFTFGATPSMPLAVFAYKNKNTGASIVTLWMNDAKPTDSNEKTLVDVNLIGVHFKNPVYVDLLTGKVYALPRPVHGSSFKQVPVYDSPILIAEKAAVSIDERVTQ